MYLEEKIGGIAFWIKVLSCIVINFWQILRQLGILYLNSIPSSIFIKKLTILRWEATQKLEK